MINSLKRARRIRGIGISLVDGMLDIVFGSLFPKPFFVFLTHSHRRPETVESLFIAWRLTGDEKYRNWGWEIFQSIEKHCKVQSGGYAAVRDVDHVPVSHDDKMETFFLVSSSRVD
jgi:hypothetical protein